MHERCVRCDQRARLAAYTGYYVFGSKSEARPKSKQKSGQVTGTLPARGFCASCFLDLAKKEGRDEAFVKSLRVKLRSS